MGCDDGESEQVKLFEVSIHAPVWGATIASKQLMTKWQFQSTHPCGVRRAAYQKPVNALGFNPRTRVGCDHPISISLRKERCFNPRTRVGCDGWLSKILFAQCVSIHAPVWGATSWCRISTAKLCFNPRTRVGCDSHRTSRDFINRVSIHAPVWGATVSVIANSFRFCFNPRTRVGCDKLNHNRQAPTKVSIHAPVWGATLKNFRHN